MTARRQPLITALLDWIVRGAEPLEGERQMQPERPATLRRPAVHEGRGDSNLFALLCRLTC